MKVPVPTTVVLFSPIPLTLSLVGIKVGKQGFIVDNHLVGAGVKTYFNTVGVGYETMRCLTNVSIRVAGGRIADGRISGGRIAAERIA